MIELFLMGVTFAPMGALLPELFPTNVRYTGAGVAYNLGGILGASVAPYIAQLLAESRRADAGSALTCRLRRQSVCSACLCMRETRDIKLTLTLASLNRSNQVAARLRGFIARAGWPHARAPAARLTAGRCRTFLRSRQNRASHSRLPIASGIAGKAGEPLIMAERDTTRKAVSMNERHARARDKTHEPLRADR